MQWSEFRPYVLPYVAGCPDPLLEHHARLVSIEFCRRTLCLVRTMDPEKTDGVSNTIDLFPDAGMQIIKVKSVQVAGQPWTLATTDHGIELVNAERQDDFAFASGQSTIEIHQLQEAGVDVVVRAALAPTMTSTVCPDELRQHMQDIGHGVAASIMLIPSQAFTNPAHGQVMQSAFNARIATVSSKVARGLSSAKMRSQATYL